MIIVEYDISEIITTLDTLIKGDPDDVVQEVLGISYFDLVGSLDNHLFPQGKVDMKSIMESADLISGIILGMGIATKIMEDQDDN